MNRLARTLMIALAATFLVISGAAVSNATPGKGVDQYPELHAFWDKYHVPKAAQETLITKLVHGQQWDALKNVAPKTVQSFKAGSDRVTVRRYSDDSIAVATMSEPGSTSGVTRGSITPQATGVSQCQYSGGSYWYSYTNCKGELNWGLYWLGFRFDYSGSYSSSSIARYWGMYSGIIAPGGQMNNKYFDRYSASDVRAYADVTSLFFSATVSFGVTVNGRTASAVGY